MLRRVVAVWVILFALFGLAVWYGSVPASATMGRFPNAGDLTDDPSDLHGHRVLVTGEIVDTDPVRLRASTASGAVTLHVDGLERTVRPGQRLQVFGVLEEDERLRAINAVEVEGRPYAWSISFLAGLWVLARIGRQWRIDYDRLTLRPRTPGATDA